MIEVEYSLVSKQVDLLLTDAAYSITLLVPFFPTGVPQESACPPSTSLISPVHCLLWPRSWFSYLVAVRIQTSCSSQIFPDGTDADWVY